MDTIVWHEEGNSNFIRLRGVRDARADPPVAVPNASVEATVLDADDAPVVGVVPHPVPLVAVNGDGDYLATLPSSAALVAGDPDVHGEVIATLPGGEVRRYPYRAIILP